MLKPKSNNWIMLALPLNILKYKISHIATHILCSAVQSCNTSNTVQNVVLISQQFKNYVQSGITWGITALDRYLLHKSNNMDITFYAI